jgi:D-amino-acid dehydrogenase
LALGVSVFGTRSHTSDLPLGYERTVMAHEHAEVVVVGGGIVGAFVAERLARAGTDVIVVDPTPGGGASFGNAGMLVPSYCMPMANPAVLADGLRALVGGDSTIALGRPVTRATLGWLGRFGLASRPGRARRDAGALAALASGAVDAYAELADTEGIDIGLRRSGWLYVCRRPGALSSQMRAARQLVDLGIRHEVLRGAELHEREPGLAGGIAGGVLYPDDASLDPAAATQAVLSSAVRHGATLHRHAILDVESAGRGIVRAVRPPPPPSPDAPLSWPPAPTAGEPVGCSACGYRSRPASAGA